jgi:hypothetical protein
MMMFLPQMRVSIVYPDGVHKCLMGLKKQANAPRPSLPSQPGRYALTGPSTHAVDINIIVACMVAGDIFADLVEIS